MSSAVITIPHNNPQQNCLYNINLIKKMHQKHRYYSNEKQSKYVLQISKDDLKNSKGRYNINQTKIKIIPERQANLSSYLPRNNITEQKVQQGSMDKTFTNTFMRNSCKNAEYLVETNSKEEYARQKSTTNQCLKNIISYQNKKKGRSYFFNKKQEDKILVKQNYTQLNVKQSRKSMAMKLSEQTEPCNKIEETMNEPTKDIDIQEIHYEMVKIQQKCKKMESS